MAKLTLKAEERNTLGRKVKKIRREGLLPANIYGKKVKSQALKLNLLEFQKVFKEAGETGLVDLKIGRSTKPVLIHNVQVDPVSDTPIHADFLQVNLKEKVTAQVPVELAGESPAEKQGIGTAVQYLDEIEVEALPNDLPEKFEIDLSKLESVDDVIKIKDLAVDTKKVTIEDDPEQIIVKVEPPKEEEEVPPVEAEGEEGEEVVKAEGEETAEAEAPSEEKGGKKEEKEEGEKK